MEDAKQKLVNSILKATSEYYRNALIQKIKLGKKQAKSKGKFTFISPKLS